GAEKDVGEGRTLAFVPARIDVEHDRPGRAGLVVGVATDEGDGEAAHADVADATLPDPPRERAVAVAEGGPAAGDASDHAARTDRVAVARLEVRAAHRVGHSAQHATSTVRGHDRAAT